MKKIIAVLLSALLLCAMGMTVLAAGTETEPAEKIADRLFMQEMIRQGNALPVQFEPSRGDGAEYYMQLRGLRKDSWEIRQSTCEIPEIGGHDCELTETIVMYIKDEKTGSVRKEIVRVYQCRVCGKKTMSNG